ncbi:hypothetical protein [Streptomyces sp. NPDC029526]|uniref:hypothetical protein n=1 Tax=Streptomyces sp. NPDC029526 TaxID=3155728 RepID=UPI0033FB1C76
MVKGALGGLVTDALLSSRLSRNVATAVSATSQGSGRSGSGRPRILTTAAHPAV